MKTKKYLYYGLTAVIALLVGIVGGIVDIVMPQNVIDMANHLGYPLYFFILLGVFKVLGGIVLLLPSSFDRLKDMAYTGFTFDFIFASYSHYSLGDPIGKIVVPLIFLVILYFSFQLKEQLKN